ncbi:MAG: TIM barrel protein [Acidobacteria bacterium]|nr:TIM barrel protein [Acidobacteriota bacterium]MBS1866618.1 TIM barrel protein [Acidobacteriota bacterium]
MIFTRRNFLGALSAACAAGVFEADLSSALPNSKAPHIEFPSAPRARLAISAWAFRFIIDAPQNDERDPKLHAIDMKDFGAHVREKFNVTNIEPYNRYFKSLEPRYLDQFHDALEKSGTHAVNIAADMETSYFDADAATRAKSVAEAKKWIDVAVAIGSPSVRTSMSSTKSSPNIDLAAESLKPVADYAASRNVVVHLENDNLVAEDALFIAALVARVNHPYVHALPDFGNSYGSGDPVFAAHAVKALFPLAYAISHVKPSSTTAQGKEMQVDLAANFVSARAANYKGYFSMEYEGKEEIHAATAKLIEQSLKLM